MAVQSVVAILAKLGVASMVMLGAAAHAAEIKVIGSPGTKEPYTLLVPDFEKASGHKVVTIWDGVNNVHKRVAGSEVADVVMVPAAQIDDLIRQGKLVPDSRVVVATSGVGVAIRAGNGFDGKHNDHLGWLGLWAGGRYHFTDRFTLTLRIGRPTLSVGVSFLL